LERDSPGKGLGGGPSGQVLKKAEEKDLFFMRGGWQRNLGNFTSPVGVPIRERGRKGKVKEELPPRGVLPY